MITDAFLKRKLIAYAYYRAIERASYIYIFELDLFTTPFFFYKIWQHFLASQLKRGPFN